MPFKKTPEQLKAAFLTELGRDEIRTVSDGKIKRLTTGDLFEHINDMVFVEAACVLIQAKIAKIKSGEISMGYGAESQKKVAGDMAIATWKNLIEKLHGRSQGGSMTR